MRQFLIGLIPALMLALPAQASEVTTYSLDNGMDVVEIEDHRAPVVVHMVWYRVGSADEPPGRSGIAHFLEHLMFKATDELASGEFSETVALNGGSDNAFTSYDYTGYFQRIAADRLELVMRMEASRMDGLALVPEDIATERDVVIEERNLRTENDAGALFNEQMRAALYLNHRYGVPIIGWKHEAHSLTLEDAEAFYKAHYGPNNAILVVAGDVQPEDVLALAETYYGVIPPNPAIQPRERTQEPPQIAERRLNYADPRIGNDYVVRTYLAPERDAGNQETAAALTILAELLGGSPTTSVFARKLQFEEQKAVYTGAWYSGQNLDDTSFGMAIVPVSGMSLDEAEAALDQALAEFLEEGVDADELDRIKMQIRAGQIYALDNVSSMANRYGAALTSGLTVEDVQAWPGILDAITAEDVLVAAAMVFDRRMSVTGHVRQTEEVSQ
ncbi:MAG: insulinase family protein [Silicimonas sp.]|nr:insulinase family protein [Silicimonas sp.]